MDYLVVAGASSLGLVIGLLIGWFLNQEQDQPLTVSGLFIVTSILSGAGVIGVFRLASSSDPLREFWFYPIGLLVGLLIAPFLDKYYISLFEEQSKKSSVSKK